MNDVLRAMLNTDDRPTQTKTYTARHVKADEPVAFPGAGKSQPDEPEDFAAGGKIQDDEPKTGERLPVMNKPVNDLWRHKSLDHLRPIPFKFTSNQVRSGTKTQTRRKLNAYARSWCEGEVFRAIDEHDQLIAPIEALTIRRQRLGDISEAEAVAEGFKDLAAFRAEWAKYYRKLDEALEVLVLEFRVLANKSDLSANLQQGSEPVHSAKEAADLPDPVNEFGRPTSLDLEHPVNDVWRQTSLDLEDFRQRVEAGAFMHDGTAMYAGRAWYYVTGILKQDLRKLDTLEDEAERQVIMKHLADFAAAWDEAQAAEDKPEASLAERYRELN